MGRYYNPPEELKTIGRKLTGAAEYKSLTAQLKEGEELYAVYDRGMFKNAPHIPHAEELEEFESQYRNGIIISREGFFAVPKQK